MKIFLSVDGSERKGYLTYSSINIDEICEDAEATEILAPQVLDAVQFPKIVDALQYLTKKLRRGATLTVGGTEPNELCKAVALKSIDLNQLNEMVYSGRQGLHSMSDVSTILQNCGLSIQRKKLEGLTYIVEAKRD